MASDFKIFCLDKVAGILFVFLERIVFRFLTLFVSILALVFFFKKEKIIYPCFYRS